MTITVYVKPSGCFGCDKTKQKFTEAGLTFTTVDVTSNPAALEYISEELGYQRVPVIVYEKDGSEDHWSGLNPDKIAQVIALDQPEPTPSPA